MIPGVHNSLAEYIRKEMGTDTVVSKNSLTYKAGCCYSPKWNNGVWGTRPLP